MSFLLPDAAILMMESCGGVRAERVNRVSPENPGGLADGHTACGTYKLTLYMEDFIMENMRKITDDKELEMMVDRIVKDVSDRALFSELRDLFSDRKKQVECCAICSFGDQSVLSRWLGGKHKPPLHVIVGVSLYLDLDYHLFRGLLSYRGFYKALALITEEVYEAVRKYPVRDAYDYILRRFGSYM